MALRLYNTLSGKKETFEPADPERVTMYVCGPTVYNNPHIGNARPAVVFDVLFRLLRHEYGPDNIVYARNITDIDDKINAAAKEAGVPIADIARVYEGIYGEDMAALGVLEPTVAPHATEHVPQMIAMIERLIAGGFAYEADGHVLFNVPSYEAYGALSRRNREDMMAGARVEVAPYKRDPADFVLWKPSTPDLPGWDGPWGRGRPGWHIECSAMAAAHLDTTIDIHGGGQDLIFPHHENEIAQSVCAHGGAPFARFWVHNGFVNVDAEKMSKSIGNVLLVSDLLAQFPGEAIRLALLKAQYRQPLDFTLDGMREAKHILDRLYRAIDACGDATPVEQDWTDPSLHSFWSALNDDLNTPRALAELQREAQFALAKRDDVVRIDQQFDFGQVKGGLLKMASILGVLQQTPRDWFAWKPGEAESIDAAKIEDMIEARNAARAARDFAEADRIRDDLAALGVQLEDGPEGTKWRRAS